MAVNEQRKRESQRTKEATRNKGGGAHKGSAQVVETNEDMGSCAIELKAEARIYLNNLKAGATLAIPKGTMRGAMKRAKTSKPMTRQQMTRDRISDNIQLFNKPDGSFMTEHDFGIYGLSTSTGASTMKQASPPIKNNEDFAA